MKDENKTKNQLIKEIADLRKLVVDPETSDPERRHREDARQRSAERYRELADSITDVFFTMDNELRYTYWNRASEQLTGISAKDALGKHLYDLFPRDEQTRRAKEKYLKVLRTRQPQHFVNEYQLGGKDFVLEISAYPSKNGLSVFVKDITERKNIEQVLQAAEQNYRNSMDNSPVGISIVDVQRWL